MSTPDLQGATTLPAEGDRIQDAGQFAALWNHAAPAERERMVATLHEHAAAWHDCLALDHPARMAEADVLRRWVNAVRALHVGSERPDSLVLWCDQDEHPWPCPTARAAGVQGTDTEPLASAVRIRAAVDAMHPRTDDDGRINASHVAAESTLRDREGLPSYIAELDGPGRFR